MKRTRLFVFCCIFAAVSHAQSPFEKVYRTTGALEHFTSGMVLSDGSMILAGYQEPYLQGYLVRTNPAGDTLWTRGYKDNMILSATESSDTAIVVAGHDKNTGHLKVGKINRSGQQLWFRELDDTVFVSAYCLKLSSDKGFFLAGGQRPENLTTYRPSVRKLDSLGNLVWATALNSTVVASAWSLSELPNGDVIVAGSTLEGSNERMLLYKLDSQGNLVWTKRYYYSTTLRNPTLAIDNNDIYILVNSLYTSILMKCDTAGTIWFARGYGNQSNPAFLSRLTKSANGLLMCGGKGTSVYSGLVVKTNMQGDTLFTHQYRPTSSGTHFYAVQDHPGGGYFLAGQTQGFNTVHYDFFSVLTDSVGRTSCSNTFAAMPLSSAAVAVGSFPVSVFSSKAFTNAVVQHTSYPMTPISECVDCIAPSAPQDLTPPHKKIGCAAKSLTFSATGTGTLQWFATATSTVALGSGSTFVTPTLSPGQYTFYVQANTCTNSVRSAVAVTVTICFSSIAENEGQRSMSVFPNPSGNGCTIDFTGRLPERVLVLDCAGRCIMNMPGSEQLKISKDRLAAGIYFIKADFRTHTELVKYVVTE